MPGSHIELEETDDSGRLIVRADRGDTAEGRVVSKKHREFAVVTVWLAYIGIVVLGAIELWFWFGDVTDVNSGVVVFGGFLVILRSFIIYAQFCYVVIGYKWSYVPIYLTLFVLTLSVTMGDITKFVDNINKASFF